MVYIVTMNESQRVIFCILILKQFGPNIQHIAEDDKTVPGILSSMPPVLKPQEYLSNIRYQCR